MLWKTKIVGGLVYYSTGVNNRRFLCKFVSMKKNDDINLFSGYLFWDVRKDSIDLDNNESYVIKRVLEFGQINDWYQLVSRYGLERIVRVTQRLRRLDPKALSFISCISSTPKTTFRCFTSKPSAQTL